MYRRVALNLLETREQREKRIICLLTPVLNH